MIIGAIIVVVVLMCANGGTDKAAAAQREKDKYAGVDEQAVPHALARADGCLSVFVWLFLICLAIALLGAALIGGMSG